MRTFSIYTLGCKVNQYESAQIRQFLEGLGLLVVEPDEKPDLFVINTCCVTATASAKSRQYVQRAAKLNPDAIRVVCGCQPMLGGKSGQGNNLCIAASRAELPAKLAEIVNGTPNSYIKAENDVRIKDEGEGFANCPKLPLLTQFAGHTRAFLKVQDGCDGVCSYCIIPRVRPDVQSKTIEDAVAEAKALVSAGHKEIVVTGVNLGAYGRSTTRRNRISYLVSRISDLLEELAKIEGLARIRVSSLEPGDISEGLLDVFCKHRNIMPHIHLSVQSGSDRILKRMCRQYSADELRKKIALIKSRLDRPAITCDLIVGFPGETEEDFEATVELAKWAGFSKMHIFPFSARTGTAAAKMKDKIQPKVVKERAEVLRNLGDCLGRKFREQFVGENCEVLLEGDKPPTGRCERYFMVEIQDDTRYSMLDTRGRQSGFAQSGYVKGCAETRGATPGSSSEAETPQCFSLRYEKNEIVKVKITAVTEEGARGEDSI
ncbi:MAG: tRNA (N(6)-L-threonylcarbamoyladenosine(37)-C(2))-methylthiotransferase MtaB [Planctomycetota bacterium]